MAIELIVNLFILFACIGSYMYVGSTMPTSPANELGAEQWPQAIIVLLVLALCINIYGIWQHGKSGGIKDSFSNLGKNTMEFLQSKLFFAMVIVVVMSLLYEPLGFIVTSLGFLMAYGYLLGQKSIGKLIIYSFLITFILYISFAVFLGVLLPRGTVPFLRNFSLFVESIIPTF